MALNLRWNGPVDEIDEDDLEVTHRKTRAVGLPAIAVAMKRTTEAMGPIRAARGLLKLNHVDGFDCQGCAWPDPSPDHRHTAEFCENGAKAVAEEATLKRVTPEFFAQHSLAELEGHTDYWLGQQGRITHPMVRRAGATHYTPASWDEAYDVIAAHLRGLASPDQAIFYTSGKTSNEAAFTYQLLARSFGTNNMPDCSNMCHESTSVALTETIGIGKGSVSLEDVHDAELIVIAGQNPGTNHPRMLQALEIAKNKGAKIIAINPLREAGLVRFDNPQTPRGITGVGTEMADLFLPVRINGDLALFQALGALLLEMEDKAAAAGRPGTVLDLAFVEQHTTGYDAWAHHLRELDWDAVDRATGLSRAEIADAARMLAASTKTVFCWAMGITQHRNSVATIKEISNLAFAQGNIGKPGAGLCPVRGHSNVQGDRTMGIWEKVPDHFLDALRDEFHFEPKREHGLDTVDSIRALRDGKASFFMGMGGNFVSAVPDTVVAEAAMRKATLTVQVSTKLNRSHVVCGETAVILPALGRSEKDFTGGRLQRVTVEDSMSAVHASHGPLEPAGPMIRSEVDIVCGLGEKVAPTVGEIPWRAFRADYSRIRESIARVVPGCAAYAEKVERPGGFVLPHPPRDTRTFTNSEGAAVFTVSPTDVLHVPQGRLLLQTMRSHDQFNTTIYGLDDRYRGVKNGRRVVFVHPDDITALGLADGGMVDLVSEWTDGSERMAPRFRIVSYETPRGCAAAYYPETNVLIPLDHTAIGSNCPSSKSVVVRLEPHPSGESQVPAGQGDGVGADDAHKSDVAPYHLS